MLPERRTRWLTSTGRVAPINSVGTMTRASVTAAVAGKLSPIVKSPTLSKMASDKTPKMPVNSSMAASKGKGGIPRRFDNQPPARLPNPRPSMKAVTTIVTNSILTPKMRNSVRCHVS